MPRLVKEPGGYENLCKRFKISPDSLMEALYIWPDLLPNLWP